MSIRFIQVLSNDFQERLGPEAIFVNTHLRQADTDEPFINKKVLDTALFKETVPQGFFKLVKGPTEQNLTLSVMLILL